MADIDARVAARRKKDLGGFTAKYQERILDRTKQFGAEVGPIWQRAAKRIDVQLRQLFKDYSNADGSLDEDKLRTLSYQIDRLEMLKRQILDELGGVEGVLRGKLTNNIAFEYSRSYFYNAWALEQAVQLTVNVPRLSYSNVMGVLANPWLPDGLTYSDRLRANTAYLGQKMYQAIGKATVEGWDVQKTARHIKDISGEGYYNSVRLARTEFTRAAGQGASNLYMENADILDGKRWNAVKDKRTAPRDAANDGKIFALDYDTPENPGVAGARIPNHPNCRCLWTPVISSLGVQTKGRIARKNDSADSFGENYYTKAANYDEYAKERGLPDLNERLANDNPKRYLRRGETEAAIKPPPTIVVGAAAAAATAKKAVEPKPQDWTQSVKDRVGQGMDTEADYVEVGALVRQELEKRLDIDSQLATLNSQVDEIVAKLNAGGDYDLHAPRLDAIKQQIGSALDKSNDRKKVVAEVLGEIRQLGPELPQPWEKGSNKEVRAVIEEVRQYLPTTWVNAISAKPIKTKKVSRGYHLAYRNYTEIALSGYSKDSMLRVGFHEMGHTVEEAIPKLYELEKQFYNRRTKGEALTWLGPGYARSEKARKDQFISPYIGKDYGESHKYTEVFSMGVEGVFTGNRPVETDPDFYNFILGVLAAL